jgi:hypothetical protein
MLVAIVSAFLGGLILNLMPCVFPVISLKVMGLVRHGDEPGRLRAEGLAFLGGVMAAMLLLAGALIAARAGGAAVGWGFQLQSPLVIAFLALVLLGAGLNLAGLFEVGLSIQQIGQGRTQRGGPMGAALTGVLAIVVATPCSPSWRGLWAMLWCSRLWWLWRSLPRWRWALRRPLPCCPSCPLWRIACRVQGHGWARSRWSWPSRCSVLPPG